ncbi:OsmC family protein [Alphaproteobacteria bacterium]|nr:OsmC family protein [Alphaproteobacteria bacterium]
MKTTVKLRATGDCPSHSLANVSVRDLTFAIDEPIERGGTNEGPTPTDTALAALIGCTNVIAHKCAEKLGLDIGHLNIAASCDFDRRGVTLTEEIDVPFERINLKIQTGSPTSDDDLNRLAAEVAKYCPLSKLFTQAGTIIEEEWTSS